MTSTSNYCGNNVKIQTCTCSYDAGLTLTFLYKLPRPPGCNQAYCGTALPWPPPPPSPPPQPPAPLPVASPPPGPASGLCHHTCPQNLTVVNELNHAWRSVNNKYSSSWLNGPNYYHEKNDYYCGVDRPFLQRPFT